MNKKKIIIVAVVTLIILIVLALIISLTINYKNLKNSTINQNSIVKTAFEIKQYETITTFKTKNKRYNISKFTDINFDNLNFTQKYSHENATKNFTFNKTNLEKGKAITLTKGSELKYLTEIKETKVTIYTTIEIKTLDVDYNDFKDIGKITITIKNYGTEKSTGNFFALTNTLIINNFSISLLINHRQKIK